MVDFLGHIAFDFDRLVATFRTRWSFVRQFKVNNQLFVSDDTCTGLDTVHFKAKSVTDGNDIIVRIVHRLLHLRYILIWFQYKNIWDETLTKVCWWYENSKINRLFNTVFYKWMNCWKKTSENRKWLQWSKLKTTLYIISVRNIHFSIWIQSILDIKYDM